MPPSAGPPADVVVVGAATRDLTDDDPRGWRLGGAVSYRPLRSPGWGCASPRSSGPMPRRRDAEELDSSARPAWTCELVPLARGPVFENIERPSRPRAACREALGSNAGGAPARLAMGSGPRGWLLAPVAGELPDAWADAPEAGGPGWSGWQGLLRTLRAGSL